MMELRSQKESDGEARGLKKTVNWLIVVAWMIFIFGFSDQNAALSSEMSGGFVQLAAKCIAFLKGFFFQNSGEVNLELLTYLIRKGAHLFLYMILGILVFRALSPEDQTALRYRYILPAVLICFLYACSDEVHQIFRSGRSGEFGDVLIDTSGAVIGLGLYFIVKVVTKTTK